eukprot:35920_1
MAIQYSTIVSIIYFSINVIFTLGLAFFVYKTGNHKLKSKSYFKDIWNQRKIFFPLIIHFYDTATDIGVIYNWAELAKDEETINYESVDMITFFWCGITFLLVYRVGILCYVCYEWWGDEAEWYYVILVILDVYIFVVVYESFNDAQGVITKNAQRRAENKNRKQQKRNLQINKKLDQAIEMGNISTNQAVDIKAALQDEEEIEPADNQMFIQLFEAVSESMPQIVLQSVFIIRSANDQALLDGGSNISLVLFSVLASLFSISNKFVWVDKNEESVCDRALSLKPRQSFPDCIHYWYVIRALWRLFHIFAKFAVFTLIWTVLGGTWLPIWAGICWIFWFILVWIVAAKMEKKKIEGFEKISQFIFGSSIYALGFLIAIVISAKEFKSHFVFKWIETTIGLAAIAIFGTLKFGCDMCASSDTRTIMKTSTSNDRVFIYFILGIVAHFMDLILYLMLYFGNILVDKRDIIHHNRWSYKFGYRTRGEPFKKLIDDHKTERITGVRLGGKDKVATIEFQVNGDWKGQIGVKTEEKMNELVLGTDEYIIQITIDKTEYVEFFTNMGNSISAAKGATDEKENITLKGNFKLVDCKGQADSSRVRMLQFLWHKICV